MGLGEFSMDFFGLKGKVAIVTGGNTGLGQGYAVALAKAGADLFITVRDGDCNETRELIEAAGQKAEFLTIDVTEDGAAQKIVDGCLKAFGHIDILINNAGTIRRAPLLEYKAEDWDAVIDVNLNAVYHLSQAAAQEMAKQKSGKIINICSMLSYQGGKFVPSYTASKHAVAGVTKAFANELAAYNIQVNGLAPGYIETANTVPIREDKARNAEITGRIPAERWGQPEDLMGAAVFLSSKASDYVTGHILAVDGGWLVR